MTDPVVIIGGGIVGLSTAWHLSRVPAVGPVLVLEKEDEVGLHQTGRNSGVIHSGIYYRPGTLKARLCRDGRQRLAAFCGERGIPYEFCGKVIVAVDEAEAGRLPGLVERGRANGVACRAIDRAELREREPHVEGRAAILVDDTGIVDFLEVTRHLAALLESSGHEVRRRSGVRAIGQEGGGYRLETTAGPVRARFLVNCAGLHADRVARMAGVDPGVRLVPFRGQYYELPGEGRRFCRHLVYPVPDPAYPFLGVHLTRRIDGRVECGPNAVPAMAREGYRFRDVNLGDLREIVAFPGFRRLALRHWRMGSAEIARALSTRRFVASLRRLVPGIEQGDLRAAPSGVRAQALTPGGELADDFVIRDARGAVHVVNAPSPAATASLAIGAFLAQHVRDRIAS
jgi:L-2-hydroxyglutarate oxidase